MFSKNEKNHLICVSLHWLIKAFLICVFIVRNATLTNIGRGTVQLKKYDQHTTNYKLGRRLLYCEAKKLLTIATT